MQINEKNLIFQKNTGLLLNLPSANFHFLVVFSGILTEPFRWTRSLPHRWLIGWENWLLDWGRTDPTFGACGDSNYGWVGLYLNQQTYEREIW